MVVIPAGEFSMGFPAGSDNPSDEQPRFPVSIGYRFAISRFEVTRDQFEAFVDDTYWGSRADTPCNGYDEPGDWGAPRSDIDWQSPGYEQDGQHPVVCVSWHDAQAYAAWLSYQTRHTYRLPTAAEYEYAHRAGVETDHFWGNEASELCDSANTADISLVAVRSAVTEGRSDPIACDDSHPFTAPVGSYIANAWQLYDMAGNVNEWVQDCWKASHEDKPHDGSAYQFDGCPLRRLKGGSWFSSLSTVRIQKNFGFSPDERTSETGFRLVRELEER